MRSQTPRTNCYLGAAYLLLHRADAWLLDWEDGLAAQLARDGEPEPIHIEETDANFSINWKGHYRIDGAAFIFVDRKTRGT